MFLVDHDETDVRKWREQGASRPHHDARRAAFDEVPLVVALPLAHARVHDRDQIAEAAAEAAHRLRRKRDLGHEHAGRAPLGKRLLDGAQVELGFARTCDAVDNDHLAAGMLARAVDGREGTILPRRERRLRRGGEAIGRDGGRDRG